MAKKRPRSAAAEAEMRRLFKDLPKQRLPMAPDTAQDRARMKRELQATLAAIGEEVQALKPHLLRRKPPKWVVVEYKELVRRSHEARLMFDAMQDAEEATQH